MIPGTGSCRKTPEIAGNGSSIPAGTWRKALEKIRKFSGRNTASTQSPELPGTGRFRAGLFDLGRNRPQQNTTSTLGDECDLLISVPRLIGSVSMNMTNPHRIQ
jgi:hypothetical protein